MRYPRENDTGASRAACSARSGSSVAPRIGSLMRRLITATTPMGTAIRKKAARHPNAHPIKPATAGPAMRPTCGAARWIEKTSGRDSGRYTSASSDV